MRRQGLRSACMLHLTRKVPKFYVADWVARRSLSSRHHDVLQCTTAELHDAAASGDRINELHASLNASWRRRVRAALPRALAADAYNIGRELCKGQPRPCQLQPWAV